jgi:hypothetical protein
MERQLWKQIVDMLKVIDKPRTKPRETYSAEEIVRVLLWAALHDRPVSWAVQRCHWPLQERRRTLPSSTTMSRRWGTPDVQALLQTIEERVLRPASLKPLVWMIDGKPLVIGNCSKDRQSGYGRAATGQARGYKLHLIRGLEGSIAAWRIAPMNKDERVMARRMLRTARIQGYLLADSNYDSNPLHEVCASRGELQLIATPRGGYGLIKRRKRQSAGRRRCLELLDNPQPHFGRTLLQERDAIERSFGNLTNWGGGLTHLPPWARTHRRVHRWVQAKLILNALKRSAFPTTYVAS